MSQELATTEKDFKAAVAEYKEAEKDAARSFLQSCIKLGSILERERDRWKKIDRWYEFLEEIGKSSSSANQFIRLFECSRNNMKELIQAGVDNWAKANMFLALPSEIKEQVANIIDEEKTTTKQFSEKVHELRDANLPEIEKDEDVGTNVLDFEQLLEEASLADTKTMAKEVLKELKKQGREFTSACLPFAQAILEIQKVIQLISQENYKQMSVGEKRYWGRALETQIAKLVNAAKG